MAKKYLLALKGKTKNEIYAYDTKKQRDEVVKIFKKNKVPYATSETNADKIAKK